MGYAKNLGKQYNAESAWSSLGTPKGWQEYYDVASQAPKHQRVYQTLSNVDTPPRSPDWNIGFNNINFNLENQIIDPQTIMNAVYQNVNNYPQQAFTNALAGKFSSVL